MQCGRGECLLGFRIGVVPGRIAVLGTFNEQGVRARRSLPGASTGRAARPEHRGHQAGGQTLLATLNMRLSEPALLIDINGIAALQGISLASTAQGQIPS